MFKSLGRPLCPLCSPFPVTGDKTTPHKKYRKNNPIQDIPVVLNFPTSKTFSKMCWVNYKFHYPGSKELTATALYSQNIERLDL
ncbi:uncharacterized protein METZ01_LOCUS233044 [marine metagenome]|uniref:Uncharacterized protein n=1 Tax=marine metagenome TaxID=408172 RepID=A0A382GYT6_9ZZZZ